MIKKALKDALPKFIGAFVGIFVGGSSVVGFLEAYNKGYKELEDNDVDKPIFWGLTCLLIIGLIGILYFFFSHRKTKKMLKVSEDNFDILYLESNNKIIERLSEIEGLKTEISTVKSIFFELNRAFSHIHFSIRAESQRDSDIREQLFKFCSDFVDVFSKTTGQQCHVSIKMTAWTEKTKRINHKNLRILTLSRDKKHNGSRGTYDGNGAKHTLGENSDYYTLYKNVDNRLGRVFFSNDLIDLAQKGNYKNSSFKFEGLKSANPFNGGMSREAIEEAWNLSYKSCIIAPICLGSHEGDVKKRQGALQGFLCVDAENINAFEEKFHKEIVVGSAEALYNTVKIFKQKYEEQLKLK